MISDQELIERVVKRKDHHAFNQLVLRYQSALRVWARRLCDGDIHLADDLAQETFLKAYSALAGFRDDAKFSTWLYRIAFNTAANRWRQKKLQWCSLDDPGFVESDRPFERDSDEDFAKTRDLNSAMAVLSPAQQLAIRLCFEDGFSHEEAAQIMSIPLGTLKTHVLRGKKKLATLLVAWQPLEA